MTDETSEIILATGLAIMMASVGVAILVGVIKHKGDEE